MGELVAFPRERIRRRRGPLGRLVQLLRAASHRAAARRRRAERERVAALRAIVQAGVRRGAGLEEIVELVAGEMYEQARAAGAGMADIGLFGPRMFRRDARAFVTAELRGRWPRRE